MQKQFPKPADQFVDSTLEHSPPAISVISEIELLCWKTDSEKDLEVLHNFLETTTVFELERAIKLKTADIRKKYNIKLPDAMIAATALFYNLTLITRNIKDFKNVAGLKLVNPFEI